MMSFALLVVLVLAYAVGKRFGLCGRDRSKSQQRNSLRRLQPVTRKSDRPNKERGVFTTDPAGNPLPFKYGFADNVGLRDHMEDRHSVSGNITGDVSKCFVGVYDGHGGSGASTFCSENMRRFLENSLRQERDPEEALRRAILRADEEYLARGEDDGTTLVAALFLGQRLFVANVGDSRSVLVQSDGTAIAMSYDHKPGRKDEKSRIEALGGRIFHFGVWRVEGILAVSRAIGDRMLKRFVTSDPEFEQRTIDAERDAYIVLATDGVWDVISNRDCGRLICRQPDAQTAAEVLLTEAIRRGSADNLCCVVVDLRSPSVIDLSAD